MLKATAFSKTVVDRELAQRDLTQWLQHLALAGRDFSVSVDWPSVDFEARPPLPRAVTELAGPKGFIGQQLDKFRKSFDSASDGLQDVSTMIVQLLLFGAIFGWPLLTNMMKTNNASAPGRSGAGSSNGTSTSTGA